MLIIECILSQQLWVSILYTSHDNWKCLIFSGPALCKYASSYLQKKTLDVQFFHVVKNILSIFLQQSNINIEWYLHLDIQHKVNHLPVRISCNMREPPASLYVWVSYWSLHMLEIWMHHLWQTWQRDKCILNLEYRYWNVRYMSVG